MRKTLFINALSTLTMLIFFTAMTYGQDSAEHQKHVDHGNEAVETVEEHEELGSETIEEEKAFNPTPVIMHHIQDSHGFHVWGEGEDAFTVPLPVILWTDRGLVTFSSGEFHHDIHGHHIVERKGMRFVNYHDDIYMVGEEGVLEFDEEKHPLNPKPLDFSITKNVFTLLMSAVLLCIIFIGVGSSYKKRGNGAPKGLAAFMEPLVVFVRDDIARPNIGYKYEKFMPFLLTVFFLIWINNLIGLIPFFPFSANLSGNIAFTMVMAVFTLLITNLNGNKAYWKHILMPPVPKALWPIMIPVELIGVLTKPFALMIRLFANITAGHIIILSLISLIFIFKTEAMAAVSVPFALFISVLELLVAALQAYIFTMLSALFIGMAVAEDHH